MKHGKWSAFERNIGKQTLENFVISQQCTGGWSKTVVTSFFCTLRFCLAIGYLPVSSSVYASIAHHPVTCLGWCQYHTPFSSFSAKNAVQVTRPQVMTLSLLACSCHKVEIFQSGESFKLKIHSSEERRLDGMLSLGRHRQCLSTP